MNILCPIDPLAFWSGVLAALFAALWLCGWCDVMLVVVAVFFFLAMAASCAAWRWGYCAGRVAEIQEGQ